MRFVDEMEFDRLGVFAYSAEEDTPAAGYPDQVPQEVKEDRRDEIMELQQEIAFEKAENMKDRVLEVMIEGKVADENAFVGRAERRWFDFCQCGCSADVRRFLPCPRNGSTRI